MDLLQLCKEQDSKFPIYTGPHYLCCFCKTLFISLPFLEKHLEKCKDMQIMMISKSLVNEVIKRKLNSKTANQKEINTIHNPHFNITYDHGEHILKMSFDITDGEKGKFSCLLCILSFDNITAYEQHMKIHKKVEKKPCRLNSKDPKHQSNNLPSSSINPKDNDNRYKCSYCYRKFDRKSSLINHSRVHSKLKAIICNECRINFKSPAAFRTHLLYGHNQRSYTCNLCEKVFKNMSMYKKHRFTEHTNKNNPQHIKKSPRNKTSNRTDEPEKNKIDNPENNKDNVLKIKVKDVFSINNSIVDNRTPENQDEVHSCELCFSIFKNTNDYNNHIKEHKVGQPKKSTYICTDCGKICPKKEDLNLHYKIAHQQFRPYKCDICLRGFRTASFLVKHATTHPENKLFKCAECKEIFQTKESHKRHVMVVHNKGGPLQCNECGKYYSNKLILEYHITTVHMVKE